MKIGFVGTGRLGLPVAVATAARGHDVLGYDVYPLASMPAQMRQLVRAERDATAAASISTMLKPTLKLGFTRSLKQLVAHSEIIFVAVQTPHDPRFGGTTRIPDDRADFDYSFLVASVRELSDAVDALPAGEGTRIVSIISTVLPGVVRREILPVTSPRIRLCYSPLFIAMGTVVRDFFEPEFVLLGVHDAGGAQEVKKFFASITSAPVQITTIENAELIKVSYNTMISWKIAFANHIMEMCESLPRTDCDEVMNTLFLGTRRLISTAYLRPGMGDGGGCHPRDNIALSHLSRQLDESMDFCDMIMRGREAQTEFLAKLIEKRAAAAALPVCILGKAFKADINLCDGSPALLLGEILRERGLAHTFHDPVVDPTAIMPRTPHVFFVGTRHTCFAALKFPTGSIVIDPHRYISGQPGVHVHRVGVYAGPAPDAQDKISLLVPTRARPAQIMRMWESARARADRPGRLELVVYVDDDDAATRDMLSARADPQIVVTGGERIVLSQMWNKCYEKATGDILWHGGDDNIFRSDHWDTAVRGAFDKYPDKIALVYGWDGARRDIATHGFRHRRWCDVTNRFVPPYFVSDFNDTWASHIGDALGRMHYSPDIFIEHMHPLYGKGDFDATHAERIERHKKGRPEAIYRAHFAEIADEARRLRLVTTGPTMSHHCEALLHAFIKLYDPLEDGDSTAPRWLIARFLNRSFRDDGPVLEVGPGDAWYADKTFPRGALDAVEVYAPTIAKHNLHEKYRRVINANIAEMDIASLPYRMVTFTDVLEHLSVDDATRILTQMRTKNIRVFVGVPYLYKQGSVHGNVHQTHIQDDLTPDIMRARYPWLVDVWRNDKYGLYVSKNWDPVTARSYSGETDVSR